MLRHAVALPLNSSGFALGAARSAVAFTATGIRNVRLGSGPYAVVNPEGVVQQRIRESWRGFSGSGSNPHGCSRTPKTLRRNGEYGQVGGNALKGCAGARYRKARRLSLSGSCVSRKALRLPLQKRGSPGRTPFAALRTSSPLHESGPVSSLAPSL